MHFITFVVTDAKPTEDVLAAALEPFRPSWEGGNGKWDWWKLGGRYTGLLIPDDPENDSITGGCAITPIEARMAEHDAEAGLQTKHHGRTGPGVDALRFYDIKELLAGIPAAVVIGGQWYAPPPAPELMARGTLRKLQQIAPGFSPPPRDDAAEFDKKCEEQEADICAWWLGEIKPRLDRCCGGTWLAVVDCHV
jgi:hypothetical protein